MGGTRRYIALDSLRGIAALSVLLHHAYLSLRGTVWGDSLAPFIDRTPINALVNGEGAVLLFFVLSGFVLHNAADVASLREYAAYLVRRWARIWIPYVAALTAFVIAMHFVRDIPGGPYHMFDAVWRTPFRLSTFFEHASLVWPLDQTQYMGVSWSLVHEMRISIIFPIAILCLGRRPWFVTAACSMVLIYGGRWVAVHYGNDQYSTGWTNTLYYSGMFLLGALVARHRDEIRVRLERVSSISWGALALVALVLYEGNLLWSSTDLLPQVPIAEIAGCVMMVALGVGAKDESALVRNRFFLWLGRISYSLYLWHALFLLVLYRALHDHVGPFGISFLLISGALLIATISARHIERPAITLGKKLSSRILRTSLLAPPSSRRSTMAERSGYESSVR